MNYPLSLYIHIPFCARRCSYCDFNTYAGLEVLIPSYVSAVCREAGITGVVFGGTPLHTLFIGGGTPSLLPLPELERIFNAVRAGFELLPEAEISLEANPGTVDLPYLRGLRSLGVNRLSLGVQSMQPEELELLGRIHTCEEVLQAVAWARQAGFTNLNLDLIFGLPNQSLESWRDTLRQALALAPEHLSLYALTLEEGTPLFGCVADARLPEPDPDLAADMYELAGQVLGEAGFRQYEISNWARDAGQVAAEFENPAYACRHNVQYWRNLPYLGLGAGACGHLPCTGYLQQEQDALPENARCMRIANLFGPQEYIQRMEDPKAHRDVLIAAPAVDQLTPIDLTTEIGETMMMGLRLTIEGVSRQGFHERFSQELEQVYGQQIDRLVGLGLLEWAGPGEDILRLTPRGRLLGNQVFMEFI